MNQQQRLKWGRIRAKGKRRYMLVAGVGAVALSVVAAALAVVVVKALVLYDAGRDPSGGVVPLVTTFVSTMVGTCAGICLAATRLWDAREKGFAARDSHRTDAAT